MGDERDDGKGEEAREEEQMDVEEEGDIPNMEKGVEPQVCAIIIRLRNNGTVLNLNVSGKFIDSLYRKRLI